MAEHSFLMPDVGEGIAQAEVVEWFVAVGDVVAADDPLGEVMTDKATIEVSSPVSGRVLQLGAAPGEVVAVGAELVRFALDVDAAVPSQPVAAPAPEPEPAPVPPAPAPALVAPDPPPTARVEPVQAPPGARTLASPAVRRRAADAGIDLGSMRGSGPAGRIEHVDLDAVLAGGGVAPAPVDEVVDVPIIGLRRRIAEQLSTSATRIPHITYVEEVDVTEIEALRATLNAQHPDRVKLTLLPFLVRAVVRAVAEHPHLNARFDDEAQVLHHHRGVHVGIATQTPRGLVVPVVRHAEHLDLWACADRVASLANAARDGSAGAVDLRGSTITISSLGALGGIATTPIINHPEVAIVGVNRIRTSPLWDGQQFVPRQVLHLSSSFDHRIVDGWDAATFVQRLRSQLEQPALLFVGGER